MAIIDKAMIPDHLCIKEEYEFLAQCAEMAPDGQFVELGPWMGASTIMIADVANRRGLPFVTVDSFPDGFSTHRPPSAHKLRVNLTHAGIDPLPRIVETESHIVPDGIDNAAFLFIDTDHQAGVLNRELDAWLPLMVVDGVVVLHDYWDRFPEMKPVIDRRLGSNPAFVKMGLVHHMIAFRRAA